MLPPVDNPVGDCAEGYYGALCSACMPGYSRSSTYECKACPEPLPNLLRIVGILIIFILGLGFFVKSTLDGATKQNM